MSKYYNEEVPMYLRRAFSDDNENTDDANTNDQDVDQDQVEQATDEAVEDVVNDADSKVSGQKVQAMFSDLFRTELATRLYAEIDAADDNSNIDVDAIADEVGDRVIDHMAANAADEIYPEVREAVADNLVQRVQAAYDGNPLDDGINPDYDDTVYVHDDDTILDKLEDDLGYDKTSVQSDLDYYPGLYSDVDGSLIYDTRLYSEIDGELYPNQALFSDYDEEEYTGLYSDVDGSLIYDTRLYSEIDGELYPNQALFSDYDEGYYDQGQYGALELASKGLSKLTTAKNYVSGAIKSGKSSLRKAAHEIGSAGKNALRNTRDYKALDLAHQDRITNKAAQQFDKLEGLKNAAGRSLATGKSVRIQKMAREKTIKDLKNHWNAVGTAIRNNGRTLGIAGGTAVGLAAAGYGAKKLYDRRKARRTQSDSESYFEQNQQGLLRNAKIAGTALATGVVADRAYLGAKKKGMFSDDKVVDVVPLEDEVTKIVEPGNDVLVVKSDDNLENGVEQLM